MLEFIFSAFVDSTMLDVYPAEDQPIVVPEPIRAKAIKFREWHDLDDAEQWHVINLLDDCGLLTCVSRRYIIDRTTKVKDQIPLPARIYH